MSTASAKAEPGSKMNRFVPSIGLVQADKRGEIYSILLPGDRELMLLHSRAGTLRGGHSHDVPEHVMVLLGSLAYKKLKPDKDITEEVLREGDSSYNGPGQVHLGFFPEDSWVLEWKICKDRKSWKNTNYKPWREKVDADAT